MRFQLLNLLPLLTLVTSTPLNSEMSHKRDFVYETLTFTFQAGPAQYQLTFPADGNTYYTNNGNAVNLIKPGNFNAYSSCNFYYNLPAGVKTPTLAPTGNGNDIAIAVGPPAPIYGVACMPTGQNGQCLPVYATCEWCSNLGGCYLLGCCSGYCAATKCRPTS